MEIDPAGIAAKASGRARRSAPRDSARVLELGSGAVRGKKGGTPDLVSRVGGEIMRSFWQDPLAGFVAVLCNDRAPSLLEFGLVAESHTDETLGAASVTGTYVKGLLQAAE